MTVARSTRKASRAFAGFGGFARGRQRGRAVPTSTGHFSFGPGGFRQSAAARRAFDNIEDVLSRCSAAWAPGQDARVSAAVSNRKSFEPAPRRDDLGHDLARRGGPGGTRRVHLPTGKEVEVEIPPGLADGRQIRLKGQGLPGPAGVGDALITIKIAPHPFFSVRRRGSESPGADHAVRGGARRQGAGADARRRGRPQHARGHQRRTNFPRRARA